MGGKWNRKAGGHIFPSDPTELLREALAGGAATNRAQSLQFFQTPEKLARDMVAGADIRERDIVLEPSGGHGAIVDAILEHSAAGRIVVVEKDPHNFQVLLNKYRNNDRILAVNLDFLTYNEGKKLKFDRVLMNPPFSVNQAALHIRRAASMLGDGGRLTSVCGESLFFRSDRISQDFREWLVEIQAVVSQLPDKSFRESGSNAKTRLICIQ